MVAEQSFFPSTPQISIKAFTTDSQIIKLHSNGIVFGKIKNGCWWHNCNVKNQGFLAFLKKKKKKLVCSIELLLLNTWFLLYDTPYRSDLCLKYFWDYTSPTFLAGAPWKFKECWKNAKISDFSNLKIGVWFAMFPNGFSKTK